MDKKNLFFIFLLFFVFAESKAQQNTVAAGGNATGSGGSISYSAGQVFYEVQNTAGTSVTQGIQQPFEISVVTANTENVPPGLNARIYPNPSAAYLHLEVSEPSANMSWQLYDQGGKLLQTNTVGGKINEIRLESYPASTYFVKIIEGGKEISNFKIVKK